MMNCVIIDDEKTSRFIIQSYCEKFDSIQILDQFESALQALDFVNSNPVDLIFLDIHMPDLSGFDFIESLNKPPKIILTTSDQNFALNAFEYDCIVDYMVKPIKLPRFVKAINKLKLQSSANVNSSNKDQTPDNNHIYVNIDRRLVKINKSDINVVEAKGDYIRIKTKAKNYVVHSTLKNIEDKLSNDMFLKIHRSFVINITKIIDIEDNSVLIEEDVIPVSRSNKKELLNRLNLL